MVEMIKRWGALASCICLALLIALGLGGCAQEEPDPTIDIADTSQGVAATVNGTEIGEAAVTAYIEKFRTTNGLEDDEDWGQWLYDYAYTVDSIRGDTLDHFESQVLLRQAAEEQGVSVSDDELNAAIDEERSGYDTDDDWKAYLDSIGLTEAAFKEQTELSLLSDKVEEVVAKDAASSDEEVLSKVKMYLDAYPGAKRSTQILFNVDDEDLAQEVLDKIESGELSFEDAVAQYSLDQVDGGDVGWDKVAEFEDEYQAALDELSVGEVSGLVKSDTGIRIILCTDELVVPEGGVSSLDQVSDSFVAFVREQTDEIAKRNAYNEWMKDYEYSSDIEEAYLPDGVSYWVDLTPFEEAAREAADEAQSSSSDAGE